MGESFTEYHTPFGFARWLKGFLETPYIEAGNDWPGKALNGLAQKGMGLVRGIHDAPLLLILSR